MTIFELESGDRVAIESLRGDVVSGRVTDCRHVGSDPYVTVQVAENVSLERPLSDVHQP